MFQAVTGLDLVYSGCDSVLQNFPIQFHFSVPYSWSLLQQDSGANLEGSEVNCSLLPLSHGQTLHSSTTHTQGFADTALLGLI